MRTRVTGSEEPPADARFCLVFPREALSVPVMRHVLGDTLGKLGVDDDCVADLLLAVTEACTNVLQHSGPGVRYEVVARVGRNRCVLEVLDGGRGFSPARVPGYRGVARPISRLRRRWAGSGVPARPAPAAPSVPSATRGRLSRPRRSADDYLAQLPESGRGLAIMQACVDDVTLRSRPGHGTVVSLQKRIELRSDAPLSGSAAVQQLRDAG
jgi:serine/threonine-protein kinase RsbW